jgi:hypothetical protein
MAPDEGRRCGREEEGAPARCMTTDGGLEGGGKRRSCLVRCMTGGWRGGGLEERMARRRDGAKLQNY